MSSKIAKKKMLGEGCLTMYSNYNTISLKKEQEEKSNLKLIQEWKKPNVWTEDKKLEENC